MPCTARALEGHGIEDRSVAVPDGAVLVLVGADHPDVGRAGGPELPDRQRPVDVDEVPGLARQVSEQGVAALVGPGHPDVVRAHRPYAQERRTGERRVDGPRGAVPVEHVTAGAHDPDVVRSDAVNARQRLGRAERDRRTTPCPSKCTAVPVSPTAQTSVSLLPQTDTKPIVVGTLVGPTGTGAGATRVRSLRAVVVPRTDARRRARSAATARSPRADNPHGRARPEHVRRIIDAWQRTRERPRPSFPVYPSCAAPRQCPAR